MTLEIVKKTTVVDGCDICLLQEELIEKLYKKLEALKEERKSLQGEIDENNGLGKRVW